MKNLSTKSLCRSAIIATLYIALTYQFAPISYAGSQFRISECLTILPLFFPESIIGLTIGCFFANIISSPLDMVVGPIASLIAGLLTFAIGHYIRHSALKFILGILPPIIINALIVPFTFLAITELKEAYFINVISVGFGQLVVLVTLGTLLYLAISKLRNKNIKCFT